MVVLVIQSFIIFLLTNHDKMVLNNCYIITIVKEVYQFSQSIGRQKLKMTIIASHNGNMINLTK